MPLRGSIAQASCSNRPIAVIGTGGVGLVFSLAMIPLVFLVFVAVSSHNVAVALPVVAVAAVLFIFLTVLQSVFNGVYKAALYRYATTGQVPTGFAPSQVQGAFLPRA
ncbi:MAG: DUF6159 family protein [Thermoplasmatota archaeon]